MDNNSGPKLPSGPFLSRHSPLTGQSFLSLLIVGVHVNGNTEHFSLFVHPFRNFKSEGVVSGRCLGVLFRGVVQVQGVSFGVLFNTMVMGERGSSYTYTQVLALPPLLQEVSVSHIVNVFGIPNEGRMRRWRSLDSGGFFLSFILSLNANAIGICFPLPRTFTIYALLVAVSFPRYANTARRN